MTILTRFITTNKFYSKLLREALTSLVVDAPQSLLELTQAPSFARLIPLLKEIGGTSVWSNRLLLKNMLEVFEQILFSHHRDQKVVLPAQFDSLPPALQLKPLYDHLNYTSHSDQRAQISARPLNIAIVLVSGVFNELFNTASFERGVKALSQKYSIPYMASKVSGSASALSNQKILKEELEQYVKEVNRPIWVIAYSKGGVDLLHYLSKNREFSDKHISAVTLLATPILGSPHIDKRFLTLLRKMADLPNFILPTKQDFLVKKMQVSLSKKRQTHWFEKNHKNLPKGPSYTALAFNLSLDESFFLSLVFGSYMDSKKQHDGLVYVEDAEFPTYFQRGLNLGILDGHHWVSAKGSLYNQEALLEALYIVLSKHHLIF